MATKITTLKNKVSGLGVNGKKVSVPKDATLLPKRKIDPKRLSHEVVVIPA